MDVAAGVAIAGLAPVRANRRPGAPGGSLPGEGPCAAAPQAPAWLEAISRLALHIIWAAALLLLTPAAGSACGVNLLLDDCGAGTSLNAATSTCASNTGPAMTLVGSILPPAGVIPQWAAMGMSIDIVTSSATLPDWWRLDTGHCRAGAIAFAGDATVSPSCPTLWDGRLPLSVFTVQPGVWGANRLRLNGGVALGDSVRDLVCDGVTELGAFRVTIMNAHTAGTGACAGCDVAACLVLQEINLQTLTGDFSSWVRMSQPLKSNYVTWQTGYPACPAATPTQNRSWGAVKAQYR